MGLSKKVCNTISILTSRRNPIYSFLIVFEVKLQIVSQSLLTTLSSVVKTSF